MTDAFLYAATVLISVGIQLYYRNADNEQLKFILTPVSSIVYGFFNIQFAYDTYLGYVNEAVGIAINRSCAGLNYSIIMYSMLIILHTSSFETHHGKVIYFLVMMPTVYVLSLFINSFRIVTSIMLMGVDSLNSVFSSVTLHYITGLMVYLVFLIVVNSLISILLQKVRFYCENDT